MRIRRNIRQPASAKWYDRRDYVFIEFCVEDSKDVNVNFEKSKLTFSCLGGSDNFKHLNEIDLFNNIDPNESKHKRTDRSILCCLRKGESGQAWPRLTKERAKLNWLSVDFNNWKDWEDDSDEDMSNFDRFSEMMNNMGGDDDVDLPEVDGADDDSPDSDDESKLVFVFFCTCATVWGLVVEGAVQSQQMCCPVSLAKSRLPANASALLRQHETI
uniref:Prostaglandin E synthase 3 n=1 Tax=Cairina moschata TaxID=8855 RepID=A0A8C3BS44_CAIMO